MRLALNTYCYEVGGVPIQQTLQSAKRFGFRFIEYAATQSGDPTRLSKGQRAEIVRMFADLGLKCSQMLLIHTADSASPVAARRRRQLEYMKACADWALELGGRQVLVCWGCGVHESDMLAEQAWLNSADTLRRYAQWGLGRGILVDLELDPHVYFVVNNLERMARMIEDVGMPNVYPNVDIGHLCITREGPGRLDKLKERILHVHLSETDTFAHTNSILGTGNADFKAYVDKVVELGIERNCRQLGETAVAGIEMGELGGHVDDPDRWVRQSLEYIKKILPELKP